MKFKIFSLLLACSTAGGCATSFTPVANTTNLNEVDFSKVEKMASGKSCSTWYFIFGPFGTQSLVNAAKNGKLSKVEVVDYSIESGFFTHSRCIIAYGR